MNHHRHAIFAGVVIQLDQFGAGVERELEGRQRILRRQRGVSAVADEQGLIMAKHSLRDRRHAMELARKRFGIKQKQL